MKNKKIIVMSIIILLMFILAGCSSTNKSVTEDKEQKVEIKQEETKTSDEKPKELIFSSGPSGGNWYAMGASFSDVLTRAGVPTSSVPGGGTQNIVAVGMGKADLGLCALASLDAAFKGAAPFDKPYSDIVMLMRLDSNPAYFIVPENSSIKDVSEIKGLKVAGPAPGTSSKMIISDVLKALGIDEEKDLDMRSGSLSEGAELFKDRNVNLYTVTTGIGNATIMDISTNIPVRFLSLSDEIINKMKEINPGYRKLIIPANTYKGQDKDVVTVTSDAALIANKNMPEAHAYWITKTLVERFGDIQQANAWLKTVNFEDMGISDGIPMHPGSIKLYQEK